MISLHLAVPAVLTAAAVAGCITYLIPEADLLPHSMARVEAGPPPARQNLSGPDFTASSSLQKYSSTDERAARAYLEAAQAILRRAPGAQASASNDELPIAGHIPLPRKRPIPR